MRLISIIILSLFLSSCTETGTNKEKETASITFSLKSNLNMPRIEAGFTIDGDLFDQIVESTGGVTFSIESTDTTISYQFEDIDGDSKPDQLFMMDDFKANQEKEYTVRILNKEDVSSNSGGKYRTNIHFATVHNPTASISSANRLTENDTKVSTYYQMEGPAWENDKVAFRNYFDQRNGIDIFGKRTTEMVLQNVGLEGTNYHELADWGMDILKVGTSLGAGAIAIEKDGQLYRITGSPSSYKLIHEGPLRSVFELAFDNIQIGDDNISLTHQISITAGKCFYQSHVNIQGLTGEAMLVSGIVNLHSDVLYYPFEEGFEGHSVICTHSKQAEDGGMLGMALICPQDDFIDKGETPEDGEGITSTYLMKMKINKEKGNDFYFFTGWETQDGAFNSQEYFILKVMEAVYDIGSPIH